MSGRSPPCKRQRKLQICSPDPIDEHLFSRQLPIMGTSGMNFLGNASILICGLDGLGLEVAKNAILGGVKRVSLYDPRKPSMWDLASHFYLSEDMLSQEHNGESLAELSKSALAELNSYVQVDVVESNRRECNDSSFPLPDLRLVRKMDVVVVCNHGCSQLDLQVWANSVHQMDVRLIIANTRGIFGQVFVDLGDEFEVNDATGEEPHSVIVQHISKSSYSKVICLEETRHKFQDGDYVTFSEVKGMVELNNCKPRQISVLGPEGFCIGDTSKMGKYISGGICTQVKQPVTLKFLTLSKALEFPDFLLSDFAKSDRPAQLHLLFQVLDQRQYGDRRRPPPRNWNKEDAENFVLEVESLVKRCPQLLCEGTAVDRRLAALFACTSSGNLGPVQAFLGGVVAQEVMKACIHRFMPIRQWFYFDCEEILPQPPVILADSSTSVEITHLAINPEDCELHSEATQTLRRYVGQISILGKHFQKRLCELHYFVVGAGAIGCELLKNFALMGVGCSPNGKIIITDMDRIEKSNLNRQFLFRSWDIGNLKSATAASTFRRMNKHANIEALDLRVGTETEDVFTDAFFEKLDGVANALDNVEARKYIDQRCVFYRKSLLESGTLGVKGSVQVVVPFLTESYGVSADPPEKSFPMCTLKNFPYAIEHTIQWARNTFQGLFYQQPLSAAAYLAAPQDCVEKILALPGQQPLEALTVLKSLLTIQRPHSFRDCVQWARELFEELFVNEINQLLHNFPPEQTTQSGTPFWIGTKRCPHPLQFNFTNQLHFDFVFSAANLRATSFGLPECRDHYQMTAMLRCCQVPPTFVPRDSVQRGVTEVAGTASTTAPFTDEEAVQRLRMELPEKSALEDVHVNPIKFEKDDDMNLHMNFIHSASNLRAENYDIAPVDKLKSKVIAGKIIPAIATSTAVVAGLVSLELIKLAQGHKLEFYKNGFFNLALPLFAFSEPIAPAKKKCLEQEYTQWDRFEVSGEMTLQQFIEHFKNNHKLFISMLAHGTALLYSIYSPKETTESRMSLTMKQLIETVSKNTLPNHVKSLVLEMSCFDENGDDLDFVPYVKYTLH